MIREERITETDTGLMEALYVALQNEILMEQIQELEGAERRIRSPFTEMICPLLHTTREQVIASVRLGMNQFLEHVQEKRPELLNVQGVRESILGGLSSPTIPDHKEVDIHDPIFQHRLQQFQQGEVGERYFAGGRKEAVQYRKEEQKLKKLQREERVISEQYAKRK